MRKLSTANISNSTGMPVKGGTLDHVQLAYQEALNAIARNLIGRDIDNTRAYILFGVLNTGSTSVMNVTAGAVYFAGEVYLVDAFNLNVSQAAVANVQTSYYQTNADPVTFTDGVQRNVHEIRKIVFTNAASGSGLFDFGNMVNTQLPLKNVQIASLPSTFTVKFDQDQSVLFEDAPVNAALSFDFTNAVPGAVVRMKWIFGAGRTLTINQPSDGVVLQDSGNLANVANNINVIYFLYTGLNATGVNEVSYTLKQAL